MVMVLPKVMGDAEGHGGGDVEVVVRQGKGEVEEGWWHAASVMFRGSVLFCIGTWFRGGCHRQLGLCHVLTRLGRRGLSEFSYHGGWFVIYRPTSL